MEIANLFDSPIKDCEFDRLTHGGELQKRQENELK